MAESNINHVYGKLRKHFGKQPLFCFTKEHLLDSIYPDAKEQKAYCLRNPVHQFTQSSVSQNQCKVNTKTVVLSEQGVNHAEGGWPKDVNYADEETTTRYRRRFERDDSYVNVILDSYKKFEHCIKQNNAIEMYDMFFKHMPSVRPVERNAIRLSNAFRDPNKRKIASLSWTFENNPMLVVAYCDKKFPVTGPVNKNLICFVWDLQNANKPSSQFLPPTACWQATCSPVNSSLILGGLEDGRVCIFDICAQEKPVMTSPDHLANRNPITALVYLQSRLNNEFFSGSFDGKCLWWDVRNHSSPLDSFIMSVNVPPGENISLANAEGINTLLYDKSFPTRFMCGTDTGLVISVNRKGKTPKEMISAVYKAQRGPVRGLQRSPCASKMFITCGDWTVNVWSEDISSSPIVAGMPHRYSINDVSWAPQRYSSFMTIGDDGIFRYWDLLRKYHGPVRSIRISSHPLLKLQPHSEGRLIAIGDTKGVLHLLSLSNKLAYSENEDKQLMLQLYERETHREHILEARVKEIRLKQGAELSEKAVDPEVEIVDDSVLLKVEEEFRRVVAEEYYRIGGSSQATRPMRKR